MTEQSPRTSLRPGFALVVFFSVLLGALVLGFALRLDGADNSSAQTPEAATAEYGKRILRHTAAVLGPDQADPALRYAGSHIACASCHLDSGAKPGALSLLEAAARYPRFSARDGVEGDLRDRINGCMERSMNGRALPRDSVEMQAMETYILTLGKQFQAMGAASKLADDPPEFVEPERAADIGAGQLVYVARCQVCHGLNGEGLVASPDINDGYAFPPLWGSDSYNNGAGMNRVLTASRFIKARMPFGQATLTDDEAFDVAAYVNSHARPQMSGLEKDYPDLSKKPIDSPYPPYADSFPQEQHQFGPFSPIRDFYQATNRN